MIMSENKPSHFVDVVSPFCEGCTRVCPDEARGCAEYKKWFAENWNKHISAASAAKPRVREFFRYEHPDLVREGITRNP